MGVLGSLYLIAIASACACIALPRLLAGRVASDALETFRGLRMRAVVVRPQPVPRVPRRIPLQYAPSYAPRTPGAPQFPYQVSMTLLYFYSVFAVTVS